MLQRRRLTECERREFLVSSDGKMKENRVFMSSIDLSGLKNVENGYNCEY
jgi:hypothetical protein